ncbi:MAG: AMP-binding protein, partial [bacterium]|nr:AMP-binding protein [bacterium]
LLAAFKILLSRFTGQEDIVVGSPIAGRNHRQIEELIGFFVNTLVLRTDLSGAPTVRELEARVRETALGAYAHQDLPFEQLVEVLQPQRDLSTTPLFQAMFILQNAPREAGDAPGLAMSPLATGGGTAKFDLTLSLQESAYGLSGALEYSTDLFDRTTIERLRAHFELLLAAIVDDPDQRLEQLPRLATPERHQLLLEWNDTAAAQPLAGTIHELFERQARRTPEAVALVFRDQRWSYRELDRRADQFAQHLRSLGVGGPASRPEARVGISAQRSAELVVALIAILKTGGAYVALDPAYPPERLAFMLEDAGVEVLVPDSSAQGGRSRKLVMLPSGGERAHTRAEGASHPTETP